MDRDFIRSYQELQVYQLAFESAMVVFDLAKEFPAEEKERLTQPLVWSSRLVCVQVAEAWQRRRYLNAFVATLNKAEAKTAQTLTWLEFAVMCSYVDGQPGQELRQQYNQILAGLGRLIDYAPAWVIRGEEER